MIVNLKEKQVVKSLSKPIVPIKDGLLREKL